MSSQLRGQGTESSPRAQRTDESSRSEQRDYKKDTLDRSGELGEEEGSRVELLPGGQVEVGGGGDEADDSPPVEAKVESGHGEDDAEGSVDGCRGA